MQVISEFIRQSLHMPPIGETVAMFDGEHATYGFYLGGRFYGMDKQPIGWKPTSWRIRK